MSKTLTTLVAPVRRGLLAAGLVGLLSASALLPAVGHAQPLPASSDSSADMSAEIDMTIKSDDTVVVKYVITDKSDYNFLTEDTCSTDTFNLNRPKDDSKTEAKASFEDKGDSRVCTIEGTQKIENLDGITHEGDEYVVEIDDSGGSSSSDDSGLRISITFPGKVTQADGGTVDGNTVTLTSLGHTVRGKDSPGLPWLWLALGLVILLAVGGGVAGVLVSQNKKKKAAAAAQAGGYVAQPLPGQVPGQQAQAPGYSPTQPLQTNPYPPQGQAPGQYPPAQPPYQG